MKYAPVLTLLSAYLLTGCATSMKMSSLPRSGDSTMVGSIRVKLIDLGAKNTQQPTQANTAAIPKELLDIPSTPYRVGPFDVLIVTVWEHPELTQPLGQFRNDMAAGQLIDADGTMFFPYVGRMKLSGLTTTEIQTQITQQLSKILKSPQVDIKVSGFRSQRAHVSGQVRNPGSIAIDDIPLTLAELLNKAGGILTSGDASGVKLVRGRKTYELDVDALMQAGAPIDSIRILPGDRLIVPSQDDRVAYVLGEVSRPSVIPLANGRSSLIRALTQTGGFTDMSSDAAGLYVVRAHDSSQVTVFSLDGRSPVALALAGQFQLRPKDLVYVDQSGLSRWYRVTQMLVPTSTIINSSMSSLTNAGVQLDLNAIKDGL